MSTVFLTVDQLKSPLFFQPPFSLSSIYGYSHLEKGADRGDR